METIGNPVAFSCHPEVFCHQFSRYCYGTGLSTAMELADSLVRITGMPFRTAHRIVGRIAASGGRPTLAELDEISLEIAGFRASERGFSETDMQRALDPRSNVALRANTGGPAPAETGRIIRERLGPEAKPDRR